MIGRNFIKRKLRLSIIHELMAIHHAKGSYSLGQCSQRRKYSNRRLVNTLKYNISSKNSKENLTLMFISDARNKRFFLLYLFLLFLGSHIGNVTKLIDTFSSPKRINLHYFFHFKLYPYQVFFY